MCQLYHHIFSQIYSTIVFFLHPRHIFHALHFKICMWWWYTATANWWKLFYWKQRESERVRVVILSVSVTTATHSRLQNTFICSYTKCQHVSICMCFSFIVKKRLRHFSRLPFSRFALDKYLSIIKIYAAFSSPYRTIAISLAWQLLKIAWIHAKLGDENRKITEASDKKFFFFRTKKWKTSLIAV